MVGDIKEIEKKLKSLVEDFKTRRDYYKSLNESTIELKLIDALFVDILGWTRNDIFKQEAVKRGDKRGRADYAFKIGEKTLFFLEVKQVGIPLDKEADKQVISYASSKQVPLAISTNFEQLKIFCVEEEDESKKILRVFKNPDEYLTRINELLLLSRESFEKNELLHLAESEGRLKRRSPIDKILLEDLMEIRKLIASDLEKRYPEKYKINERDELVQRIIDRLIFVRRAEDIGIAPENLRIQDINGVSGDKAYPKLKEIFSKYNDLYNSGLFDPNYDSDCDKIIIDGEIIKKLTKLLYESKDKQYIYNFDWIDADVLGQVYEQYLGKILAQTKSGRAKLNEGQAHRKEQGIYYTPTYIVDYIVKNTLGVLLKDKKVDSSSIKILDPACGSGSFLIKAYDVLAEHIINKDDDSKQHRIDEQGNYSVKTQILKNNIYGVDLDNKAVEITKLNLLLKAAEKNRKLPDEAHLHIRHGNSLIDDSDIAGTNAFKWVNDFEEGSFDVVIGNPPYGAELDEYKSHLEKHYKTIMGKTNSYRLFIELGIKLLKNKGLLGLIVPNTWLSDNDSQLIRELILTKTKIIKILVLPESLHVFEGVTQATTVIIIQKEDAKNKIDNNIIIMLDNVNKKENFDSFITGKISQKTFYNIEGLKIITNKSVLDIIEKVRKIGTEKLNKYFIINQGEVNLTIYKKHLRNKSESETRILIRGDNIRRYNLVDSSKNKENHVIFKGLKRDDSNRNRIILQEVSNMGQNRRIKATFLKANIANLGHTANYLYFIESSSNNPNINYFLGLLNSKVLDFYFKTFSNTNHISGKEIKSLPIKIGDEKIQKLISDRVEKMLITNQNINGFGDKKTSERLKLEQERDKLDVEIDDLIYKLYGITEDEKKIIENELQKK